MNFVPSDGNDEQSRLIQELDTLVQNLTAADLRGRSAAANGDREVAAEVAILVSSAIGEITWGAIPTVIMHFAGHVGMARADAGRMAQTCLAAADGLTKVSQIMAESGAPVEMCAQLMDLAVELRTSGDECLYETVDNDEECTHE